MKEIGVKTWVAWTAWVIILMIASAADYVFYPRPGPSVLAIEPWNPDDRFDKSATIKLRVSLSRQAPERLPVAVSISGAKEGVDYKSAVASGTDIVIRPGELAAEFTLEKLPPPTFGRRTKTKKVPHTLVVELAAPPGDAYVLDATKSKVELSFETIEEDRDFLPQIPVLALSRSAKDEEGFSDNVDKFTIYFELKPAPDFPVNVEYRLGGDAVEGTDYIVRNRPPGNRIPFPEAVSRQSIVLERRTGASDRGKGERWITISFVPNKDVNPGDVTVLRVKVPDPRARLSWRLTQNQFKSREDGATRLVAELSRTFGEEVTLRYQVSPADPGSLFELPASDARGLRSIVIRSHQSPPMQDRIINIHKDELVGGPPRSLKLTCTSVRPEGLADPKEQPELTLSVTDDEPLEGSGLVLLILTEDLLRRGEAALDEVLNVVDQRQSELVGQTVYVLDGDGKIFRWNARSKSLKGRKPFSASTAFETILGACYQAIPRQFGKRIVDSSHQTFLIWQDFADRRVVGVAEVDERKPPNTRCYLYFVGPDTKFARLLRDRFPAVDGSERFFAKDDWGNRRLSNSIINKLPKKP